MVLGLLIVLLKNQFLGFFLAGGESSEMSGMKCLKDRKSVGIALGGGGRLSNPVLSGALPCGGPLGSAAPGRLSGLGLLAARSWLGQQHPEEFRVILLGLH